MARRVERPSRNVRLVVSIRNNFVTAGTLRDRFPLLISKCSKTEKPIEMIDFFSGAKSKRLFFGTNRFVPFNAREGNPESSEHFLEAHFSPRNRPSKRKNRPVWEPFSHHISVLSWSDRNRLLLRSVGPTGTHFFSGRTKTSAGTCEIFC